jgi:glutamate-ammonia-ligase adenylyltransferase
MTRHSPHEGSPRSLIDSRERVLGASDFVAQACERAPRLLPGLAESGELDRPLSAAEYFLQADRLLESARDEPAFMAALRHWRRREMVRIAWRDLAGAAPLGETLRELSAFADAAIHAAYEHARLQLIERYGTPRSPEGIEQPLLVLAMGKLGGGELNFSSDVDLVFLFPEHGETDGARSIANEEFFTRLGQTLSRLLATPTAEGFVFRVDLRLRPFGDSGPLVASFASFEDYLQRHGRDWERYAYVKARPVTGREHYPELYERAVRPFVYRRYLDFGVFDSLREMKALIEREVERRERLDDVKLGPGGIREIEFVVQAFQLVRGGQDRRLQNPSLLEVLPLLAGAKLLPATAVAELHGAYVFLRRLENRLQMLADRQTHRLPDEETARARVAAAMEETDWPALTARLEAHRVRVIDHFRSVVFSARGDDAQRSDAGADLGRLWEAQADGAALAEELTALGVPEPREIGRLLAELRGSSLARRLDEHGRRRLQTLLPLLVTEVARASDPAATLRRVLRIVEAIGQRSSYFSLLTENRAARTRLVELCAHGDFLATQIAQHPLLLDELIDERLLSELPDRAQLAADLELRLGQAPDDPEAQVEALKQFQRAAIFRIAVADLMGRLPLMRVSDRLTDVAELIVERAMQLAWRQITAQFGVPMCGSGAARRAVRVCAIGYGKLGGIELGYASDLDLVFLHDSGGEDQETDAPKPLDNQVFFVRLAQRIVHLLTVHTAAGRLYEVDMRLRPSGKGGMLVTNIEAFRDYQQKEAWTWEHQALLHARAVAGAPELRASFERVRMEVLMHNVRRETLRDDVRGMRERMRRELSKAKPGQFDLKRDAGGIGDIEFLAQYWALAWAKSHPPVAMFSDTIRQLESVASADLVPQSTVDVLTGAYRRYRERIHHLSLEGTEAIASAAELETERRAVTAIWEATFANAPAASV